MGQKIWTMAQRYAASTAALNGSTRDLNVIPGGVECYWTKEWQSFRVDWEKQVRGAGERETQEKHENLQPPFIVPLSLSLCVCVSMSINGGAVSHTDRKVRDSVTLQLSAEPFLWHAGTLSFRHHGNTAEDNTVLSIAITQVSDWDWSAMSTRRIISRSSLCSSSHG